MMMNVTPRFGTAVLALPTVMLSAQKSAQVRDTVREMGSTQGHQVFTYGFQTRNGLQEFLMVDGPHADTVMVQGTLKAARAMGDPEQTALSQRLMNWMAQQSGLKTFAQLKSPKVDVD
jgi:hypothetical protein